MCDRCETLEAENRALKAQLGVAIAQRAADHLKNALGVNLQQACVVAALYEFKGRAMGTWAIIEALREVYPYKRSDDKIVNVLVHRVRKALGRDFVENLWGVGYRLSDAGRARCDAILEPQQVAA